jgi:GTPase SAR1 family protein
VQIAWETGGQDWVDELKDNEYKMAKPPGSSKSHQAPLKRKRTVKEAKILVYGLPGSGKTSIINKLAELSGQRNSSGQGVAPTHMFDVSRLYWGGTGSDVKLTVFDFGGAPPCLVLYPCN